ncbi:unnamed protein product [Ostreobium quekettii]|uniref:PsbP C-terminal domain-containing protein n=1 Tax=Ostreobium quekettii TaxID=121088 RepID=A0A8S1ITM6_9CHLO|nr:unnamed protein product [Ostreobium quekettii]|eukprot:evm.model.scf_148EXC.6 EVM.evm.TU.scf_148EXC.6   scf_148EXC:65486-66265(-)
MALSSTKPLASAKAIAGQKVAPKCPQGMAACRPRTVSVRAEADDVSRRAAMGMVAGGVAILAGAKPSEAAYGETANVFGSITNPSGFIPFSGDGYVVLLPSKWNPSPERDFKNIDMRWEDNFEPLSHVLVTKTKASSGSIEGYGSPDAFLKSIGNYLGESVWLSDGDTQSEGGFAKNKVSSASLLDVATAKDKKGKSYYKYELFVRSADGNEGGRHVLLTAAVGSGNLYVQKVQCGDKRWMKGGPRVDAETVHNSFAVA